MTNPQQFFDPATVAAFQAATAQAGYPPAGAPPDAQFYGQAAGGFAPPQPSYNQLPPPPAGGGGVAYQQGAPQGYAPPQHYYGPAPAQGGYMPQQGYGQGGYMPAPPAPPVQMVEGDLDDFFNQVGGAGKSLEFDQVGRQHVVMLKRDLVKGDVRQRTDPNTKLPVYGPDGKPKFVLVLPLVNAQGEDCSWWLSAADKDALVEALTRAAGQPLKRPFKGTILRVTYSHDRKNRAGLAPSKMKTVEVLKLPDDWRTKVADADGRAAAEAHVAEQTTREAELERIGRQAAEMHVAAQAAFEVPAAPAAQPATEQGPSAFAAPAQQYAMVPGANGGPVAVPANIDPAQFAAWQEAQVQWQNAAAQAAPAPAPTPQPAQAPAAPTPQPAQAPAAPAAPAGPGEDAVMAKMQELLKAGG